MNRQPPRKPSRTASTRGRQLRRLVLDDDPLRLAHFRERLPGCVTVSTYADAIAALRGRRFSEVYLDHDIASVRTGADVAAWMATHLPARKRPRLVVVHSVNKRGALDMRTTLEAAGFVVERRPFESGPGSAAPDAPARTTR